MSQVNWDINGLVLGVKIDCCIKLSEKELFNLLAGNRVTKEVFESTGRSFELVIGISKEPDNIKE